MSDDKELLLHQLKNPPVMSMALNKDHLYQMMAERMQEAADRIEELSKERDQHWDSFVHWRKEADDRSEQLAAARQDAKEAEAYAAELEKGRDVASIWNEAVDEALDILDDEGWLGESRERIELLKKPLGGKDE